MKILILTSGGDAPGMNKVIALMQKKFKDSLYACEEGFKGLIEGKIALASTFSPLASENEAGSCIRCSRCPEFKTKKGFKKALENAKRFDYVVVLGGNGSYKGCCELNENGVKTIFIPSTIDNDVKISEYSQGFDSALHACKYVIENTMPTMAAFKRCAIFEVMGRECPLLAQSTQEEENCDYLISSQKDIDFQKISDIINENYRQNLATSIIIKERLISSEELMSKLSALCPNVEMRYIKVGYLQRGVKPTKKELYFAKNFARLAIKLIKENKKSRAIIYKNNAFQTY